MTLQPLFKWTGSKRKMFPKYEEQKCFDNLGEPKAFVDLFGGTGVSSVWWYKNYGASVPIFLNEYNTGIYEIYEQIKNNFEMFKSTVDSFQEDYMSRDQAGRRAMYLEHRDIYHDGVADKSLSLEQRAPLLYALMSTNFNGIWQAKAATQIYFTPFGNGLEKKGIYNPDALKDFKEMVDYATISNLSYEEVEGYPEGSFLFLDPPYISSHTQYDRSKPFGGNMHEDLVLWTLEKSKTHKIGFCNKAHEMFDDAFTKEKGFTIHPFGVKYTASAQRKTVGDSGEEIAADLPVAREILVTNY